MSELVFATNNKHKLREVRQLLPPGIHLLSLEDIGCKDELPETGSTLEQNARQKATYVHEKYGVNCFADDTGLEVEALDNRPGVYSARFAGPENNPEDNNRKLLIELKSELNRKARFRTVICVILGSDKLFFEGVIQGRIANKASGNHGFGYDPLFIPEGHERTFAEMSEEEKNALSHRGRAMQSFTAWLREKMQ